MEHGRGAGAKSTVLVVDDEPLVRMTTAEMLRSPRVGAQCLRKPVPLRELIAMVSQAIDGNHSTHIKGAVQ